MDICYGNEMKRRYLEPVKLKNGKWTFVNSDGILWSDLYGDEAMFIFICNFHEGFAAVQLQNGEWTFVDKNEKMWKQKFDFVCDFHEGFACVRVCDGWTFVDKDGNLFKERFASQSVFSNGLAKVITNDESKKICYLDKYQNLWDEKHAEYFKEIYKNSEYVFQLEQNLLSSKKFLKTALSVIVQRLDDMRKEMPKEQFEQYKNKLNQNIQDKFSSIIVLIERDEQNKSGNFEY